MKKTATNARPRRKKRAIERLAPDWVGAYETTGDVVRVDLHGDGRIVREVARMASFPPVASPHEDSYLVRFVRWCLFQHQYDDTYLPRPAWLWKDRTR